MSRIAEVSYPSGLTVRHAYNAVGYQTSVTNLATGEVYWTANARDAELRLIEETAGNGVATSRTFDPLTGQLSAIRTGMGASVQSFDYTYDALGKLTRRSDANTGLSESFGYDGLNRLTSATVGVSLAKTYAYDAVGNLTAKSDVGAYTYPAPGQPRPHAVSAIAGVVNTSFSYDGNGNLVSGHGLTLTYTAFNKPETIARGASLIRFAHDPEQQRFRQISPAGETLYLAAGGVMAERLAGAGGTVQWTNYIAAGGTLAAMRVEHALSGAFMRYFHTDHLGSIATITDETGAVVQLSYDAWGKRRFADGADDPTGSIASQTTRGFTGRAQAARRAVAHRR